MHVSHYLLLGFFSGLPAPPVQPTARPTQFGSGSGRGWHVDEQIEMGNAAAIQFMILATLAIEELH